MDHVFSDPVGKHKRTFAKYHGNGNDFIIFDALSKSDSKEEQWLVAHAKKLCDRFFGIGADGVIRLEKKGNHVRMVVVNRDGSMAKNCGNGIRCAALHIFKSQSVTNVVLELADRFYQCQLRDKEITVSMGECLVMPTADVYLRKHPDPVKTALVYIGNRHRVYFFDRPITNMTAMIKELSSAHKEDNLGFFYEHAPGQLYSKVYERGVGFTKSCGSGACAAVAFYDLLFAKAANKEHLVVQPGGILKIETQKISRSDGSFMFNVTQTGPAEEVFRGICQIGAN